jgi:hypothetical protein
LSVGLRSMKPWWTLNSELLADGAGVRARCKRVERATLAKAEELLLPDPIVAEVVYVLELWRSSSAR